MAARSRGRDFVHVLREGLLRVGGEVRVPLDERRHVSLVESEEVVHHEPLRVAHGSRADADRGDLQRGGDFSRQFVRHALERDGERARRLHGLRVLEHLQRGLARLALRLEAAVGVDALGRHAHVREDGDAGVGHAADEPAHARAAFQLHAVRPRLQAGDGVRHRRVVAALVGAERHVRDHERVFRRARHGGRGGERLLHRHGKRGGVAERHHAHRVAHEDARHARLIGQAREARVVRRAAAKLAHALRGPESCNCPLFHSAISIAYLARCVDRFVISGCRSYGPLRRDR